MGKDGSVFQMVKEADRAWHAGESFWKGRHDINDFSIGIEMVNRNDGLDPWPDVQVDAVLKLCRHLVNKYGIVRDNVVTHEWIAGYAGRGKTDPLGFPMNAFLDSLFDVGEGFDFHYVLLGQTVEGIVPWTWIEALKAYLQRFRVTIGFSHDHAMMASPKTKSRRITIIGSPNAPVPVSEEYREHLAGQWGDRGTHTGDDGCRDQAGDGPSGCDWPALTQHETRSEGRFTALVSRQDRILTELRPISDQAW